MIVNAGGHVLDVAMDYLFSDLMDCVQWIRVADEGVADVNIRGQTRRRNFVEAV